MATATKPRPKPKPAAKTAPAAAPKAKPTRGKAPAAAAKPTTEKASTSKARPVRKAPTKAAAAPKAVKPKEAVVATVRAPRELDVNGYVPDSDSALIAWAMLEGAEDRRGVNDKASALIEGKNGLNTRNGTVKNVPSLGANILRQLKEKGYTIQSTWKLVPPAEVAADIKKAQQAAARKAARANKTR